MLTPDVAFEGFSPTDWSRLLALFAPAPQAVAFSGDSSREAPRGALVLVHDGRRVRKALHTVDGRIDPQTIAWPRPLGDVAHAHRARLLWAVRAGALEELMDRFAVRVRRGDDALTQALSLMAVVRELLAEGSIESWPRKLRDVPIPARSVVDRAVDAVVAPGRTLLLSLYDGSELHTALVVRRAPGAPARFDRIVGPSDLRAELGPAPLEFRRDHRRLVEVVEARHGLVSCGLHAEASSFRALITSAKPGDWARAVALRDVVLSPMPPLLGLPLGVDATRGAVAWVARTARRLDPLGVVRPALELVTRRLPRAPAGEGGASAFDPLEVLRRLLQR